MRVLAVDLGGTHAECALVEDARVLAKELVAIHDLTALGPILPLIAASLERLNRDGSAQGVGFGFCGLVDARNARVSSTNEKFNDAVEIDLRDWARSQFGLPLKLENDARLALLGEWYAGAAQEQSEVVMFTLGTGIGGVAMIDGKLLRGKHGQAGVLGGHMPVRVGGRRCTCGGLGCAESEASGWALPIICHDWPGFAESALAQLTINFENLFSSAAAGDSIAREIQHHCLNVWGAAAVAAIHAFDPELLVYGGGVMKSAEIIIPFIQDYVNRYAWTPWGKVQVRAAQLGNDAALVGVIPLFEQENNGVR
jgi:glucokinase